MLYAGGPEVAWRAGGLKLSRKTDYTPYAKLTAEEKYGELLKIERFLTGYAKDVGLNLNEVACRKKVLLDIVEKVEKRRVYFKVFHKIEMSEKYEAALYGFWIVKLAPFYDIKDPDNQLCVKFSTYLLLKIIGKIEKRQYPLLNVKFGKEHTKSLEYAFLYWDLSKESVMLIADLLLRQSYPAESR